MVVEIGSPNFRPVPEKIKASMIVFAFGIL